jgi:hypothetical protein
VVTDPTLRGQFADAMDFGDNPAEYGRRDIRTRPGAMPNLAPRAQLGRPERETQVVIVKQASNPRRYARNIAEIGRS